MARLPCRELEAPSENTMAQRHMIDDMDLKIMKRLELDARISNVHLAEAVHLSPSACLNASNRSKRTA